MAVPADFPPPLTERKGSFVIHLWGNINEYKIKNVLDLLQKKSSVTINSFLTALGPLKLMQS
jgi:hypothetical protein